MTPEELFMLHSGEEPLSEDFIADGELEAEFFDDLFDESISEREEL